MSDEVAHTHGYIVIDDYSDPVRAQYWLYHDKEDAIEAAKQRLRQILDCEEMLDDEARLGGLLQNLEDYGQTHISGLAAGWSDNNILIRVARVTTQGD